MSTSCAQSSDDLIGIMPLLVLGAGFVALFAGFDYFYVIWIIGFTVLVPITAILLDGNGEREDEWTAEDTQHGTEHDSTTTAQSSSSPSTQDALSTLRERYANGELTDTQFERKLDRLLETETPENAAEWRDRTTRETKTEKVR
jgi:uncharacterized membrane protein